MNRTFAVFLALATLLAHALALHQDPVGGLAPPYETSYVAFRLARNLAQTGDFFWDPALPAAESYPSILWVLLCAIPEGLSRSVNHFSQYLGIACALLTVLAVARFRPHRLAGVIAPALLVVSGGIAAAATSGTEIAAVALLVTLSFLNYENRRPLALGVCLSLLYLSRPEGALLVWVFGALAVAAKIRRPRRVDGTPEAPPPSLWAFAPPAICAAVVMGIRASWSGHPLSPTLRDLVEGHGFQWREGLGYVFDFVKGSGGPALVICPIWYALRRALTTSGRRALILVFSWSLVVAAGGGQALPFSAQMVPVLPVLYVAVQEALTLAMDSRRRFVPHLAKVAFGFGLVASVLASKFPGNLGVLPTESLHRAWMRPTTASRFGYEGSLGRTGLAEEIERVLALRAVGVFLRDQLDPAHSILTPWPGAIGYLTRLRVVDALGRVTPAPGSEAVISWNGRPRADVSLDLALEPEYIVPLISFRDRSPTVWEITADWVNGLDLHPSASPRTLAIFEALTAYELLAVPMTVPGLAGSGSRQTFYLLRRKDLDLAPKLSLVEDGDRIHVEVAHSSHNQVADLRVQMKSQPGGVLNLLPHGEWAAGPSYLARTSILLYPTGSKRVRLISFDRPTVEGAQEVRAVLRNPGATPETRLVANTSEEVVLSLRR